MARGMQALRDGSASDGERARDRAASAARGFVAAALRRTARARRTVARRLRGPSLDPLTRLGDRTALTDHGLDTLRPGLPARALLLLDLDGFKHVNDTLGHLAGDQVLREVADRIAAAVDPGDVAVRLGGDEFAVLTAPLEDEPAVAATDRAERLVRALAEPVPVDGMTLPVAASVGVAVHGVDGTGLEALMRAADQAMYDAKSARRAGRPGGHWRRVGASSGAPTGGTAGVGKDPLDLAADLRRALARGAGADGLVLHHQPQLGWDGVVRGFEALVRWRHDDLGLLPPRRFLPAAERAGLLSEVTTRVLQLALTDHAALGALCPGATISVNVPARDLLSQEFLPALARTLADTGVAPGVLLLEVAEPAPYPVPAVVELFGALGRLGVGVSLHEFGAGHSSLTALADSPGLREVKVDPTLVRRMTGDTGAERLVRAIVHAAHGLEVEVVAEGVEDAATVAAARRLACDRVQGFWFSAPLPLAEVGDWHARWLAEQPAKLPVLTP